jgi:simple sugar transport system substrate-binding protein
MLLRADHRPGRGRTFAVEDRTEPALLARPPDHARTAEEELGMDGSRSEARGRHRARSAVAFVVLAFTAGACAAAAPSAPPGATGSVAPASPAGGGGSATGRFCEGTRLVFFPGGTPGGGFETVVYNGAKAAEAAFGPTVAYQWSDWDPQKMIQQFQEAVATNPDGIAVMGHPGDDAFKPLVDDAVAKGILVTAMNTELSELQATYATQGFGYVGAVLYDAGAALANEAMRRGTLASGDKVFVWGLKSQPGRGQRTLGITETLEEAGLEVVYLEIDDATNADPAAGIPAFTGMASANTDLKAIFIDHGNLTSTIPTYMESANLEAGSIYAAGFDLSPSTVQGIKDGFVSLVIDQQQYLQGFEAVLQLCLSHSYQFSGLFIDTGGGFVDESNVDAIAPLVEQQIR